PFSRQLMNSAGRASPSVGRVCGRPGGWQSFPTPARRLPANEAVLPSPRTGVAPPALVDYLPGTKGDPQDAPRSGSRNPAGRADGARSVPADFTTRDGREDAGRPAVAQVLLPWRLPPPPFGQLEGTHGRAGKAGCGGRLAHDRTDPRKRRFTE